MPSRTRRRLIVVAPETPPSTPVEASMDALAAAATQALGLPIVPATQRDATRGWTAAAVHPLQPSQTAWLRMVRGASFGIGAPGERAAVETAAMERLFVAGEDTPALLGVPPGAVYEGEGYPLPDDRLNGARRMLKQALRTIGEAKDGLPIEGDGISRRLRAVRDILLPLAEALAGPAEAGGVAPFAEERRQLIGLDQEMAAARSWDAVEAIAAGLALVADTLGDAAQAAAGVQLSYAAEAACRLRLAVRFKVRYDARLPADRLAAANRALTRLLNGGYPQLAGWLRDRMRTLAQRVAEIDPSGNSRFVVLEDGSDGARGWTARLLINPGLPAPAWFALFQRLHNVFLMTLFALKLELYGLLHRLAGTPPTADLAADGAAGGLEKADGREPAEYGRNGCAAVLVDVGIPRHGTLALQQQWRRFTGDVRVEDGLPRPGMAYRLTSALRAVNALCQSTTAPQNAAPALIARLQGLLANRDQATADGIAAIRARIREGVVPLSLKAIDGLGDAAVQRLLVVMLEQVCQSYGLATDSALAAAFDGWFAAKVPGYATLTALPAEVADSITAAKDRGAWSDGAAAIADAVGFGLWVSMTMESHLAKRASFLGACFGDTDRLLRRLTALPSSAGALPDPAIQPVIEGPWAAALHLDHCWPREGYGESASPVDILLRDGKAGRQPNEILTAVASLVEDWLATQRSGFALRRDGGGLAIVWNAETELAPFRYRPVAATVSVTAAAQGGPPPSLVNGLPVAALSETIRSVRQSVARTDDYAVHSRLAGTLNALTAASLRDGAPEGADPSVTALRQGRCRHLMLSSAELAQGAAADYPRSYYPDDAFRIVLGANPVEVGHWLSLPIGKAADRTLDLLVVNQGSGGIDRLSPGPWTVEAMVRNIVAPLKRSGVGVRTILLDHPMSAAMIPAFQPLCAPDGRIIGTLYGTGVPVMDRALWEAGRPALSEGDAKALDRLIDEQIGRLSAGLTGRIHLNDFLAASDAMIHAHLAEHPDGQGAVSLLRCLKPIGDTLSDPDAPLDRIEAMVRTLRGNSLSRPLPWTDFADADKAVLEGFPTEAGSMTADSLGQLRDRLRRRVTEVLTDPAWKIALDPAALDALPLFGSADSLWGRIGSRWANLLALDPGLSRCPSSVALYDARTGQLRLDAAFNAFDGKLEETLRRAAPGADREAAECVADLRYGQDSIPLQWVESCWQ
ncbi:hypothetical protein [Azospirillum brasilense]|uniref:hypothetical protein n=1 Tax=Azospirillum brasilense TaxID=192 RepID=UPI0018D59300|nr:hypothetical protein [Azospirillum brasilense]